MIIIIASLSLLFTIFVFFDLSKLRKSSEVEINPGVYSFLFSSLLPYFPFMLISFFFMLINFGGVGWPNNYSSFSYDDAYFISQLLLIFLYFIYRLTLIREQKDKRPTIATPSNFNNISSLLLFAFAIFVNGVTCFSLYIFS